jgi:hypothetical protein
VALGGCSTLACIRDAHKQVPARSNQHI